MTLRAMIGLLAVFSTVPATLAANPIVSVRNGSYEGLYLPQFEQDLFLGMPYAQNTTGENRFRIPQSLTDAWTGVRDAKEYSHACPDDAGGYTSGMGEDCLSLNVIRPAGLRADAKAPVMVWIHGGSYQYGASSYADYNLTYIVQRSVEIGKPIVGVSINYRKGAWGNMYSIEIQGSGNTNLALRDMRKALAWIQENISNFGGDKSSVTIWGESSGSFAVGQLVMSYGGRTDGLFHRSIQESGSAATAWYNGSEWYQPLYNKIVDGVNCSDASDTLGCLRQVPYETLLPLMNSYAPGINGYYPTVDGDVIPNYPTELLHSGRFAHIPHLYGTNSDEGTANAPAGMDTDEQLHTYLLQGFGYGYPESVVDKIMELYPDDPAQGVPINTGAERFAEHGEQYKRAAAIAGDIFYHAPRLDDARHYAAYAPTYIYRFNTRPFQNSTNATYTDLSGELDAAYQGVKHYSEVAFVFANPAKVGPWPEYVALSDQMSSQWIHFVHSGSPNGDGLPRWPVYNEDPRGLNLVLQTDSQGGAYVEPDEYRLAGREYLTKWARRRHV